MSKQANQGEENQDFPEKDVLLGNRRVLSPCLTICLIAGHSTLSWCQEHAWNVAWSKVKVTASSQDLQRKRPRDWIPLGYL